MRIATTCAIGLLSCAANLASADELVMKNGSRLIGTLVSAEDGTVVFDTPFAGKLSVKEANIEQITTTKPVTLKLDNGQILKERQIVRTETGTVATAEGQPSVSFTPKEIALINPHPYLLGEGYKWFGNLSVAMESKRGNSDTDEWDFAAASTWRSLTDRYVLKGWAEYDENSGDKVTENWKLHSKYDRFSEDSQKNYYGAKLRFEYDKFKDLDLRTMIGPHIGRQFYESPLITLSGEIGPVWVDEQFDVAEDDDYYAALWEIEASSDIVGFGTTLYAIHDGTLNFDETDEPVLNTRVGIRLPLIYGVETKLEVLYEYDGGAVEGVDDTDETYTFGIGYAW
jgi:hypothetical protein